MTALPANAIELATSAPSSCVKALILDDSQFDRMKVRRLFEEANLPHSLTEVGTVKDMEVALAAKSYDIVLIDYNLSDSNGLEALNRLKAKAQTASIMITGDDKSQVAVQALKMGCSDYIAKQDLSSDRLRESIFSAIESARRPENEAADLQSVDKLTDKIMSKYSQALQPEVAGLVREIRSIKSATTFNALEVQGKLQSVEKRCINLWEVLRNPLENRKPKTPLG